MSLIALITDFSTRDWYVAEMKGAILGVDRNATIVDITHHTAPGDVRNAAFILAACMDSFPVATVFCAVADPGVGSVRRAIVARSDKYFFVGPDNGILSFALGRSAGVSVRTLDNVRFFRKAPLSATFHGRDIFAPAAAHLGAGLSFGSAGQPVDDYVRIDFPQPLVVGPSITAEVMAIDSFGNVVTSIASSQINHINAATADLVLPGGRHNIKRGDYYHCVAPGEPIIYGGSCGYIEIGINGGDAAKRFGVSVRERIELVFS